MMGRRLVSRSPCNPVVGLIQLASHQHLHREGNFAAPGDIHDAVKFGQRFFQLAHCSVFLAR